MRRLGSVVLCMAAAFAICAAAAASASAGCRLASVACQSGATAGEIVSAPLQGRLGLVLTEANPESSEAGIGLYPPADEPFAQFECGSTAVTVTGSVIHQVRSTRCCSTKARSSSCTTRASRTRKPRHPVGRPADHRTHGRARDVDQRRRRLATGTAVDEDPQQRRKDRGQHGRIGGCPRSRSRCSGGHKCPPGHGRMRPCLGGPHAAPRRPAHVPAGRAEDHG